MKKVFHSKNTNWWIGLFFLASQPGNFSNQNASVPSAVRLRPLLRPVLLEAAAAEATTLEAAEPIVIEIRHLWVPWEQSIAQ